MCISRFERYLFDRWARIEHPRFGLITAIRAIKNLAPGEEVLVNYGMGKLG